MYIHTDIFRLSTALSDAADVNCCANIMKTKTKLSWDTTLKSIEVANSLHLSCDTGMLLVNSLSCAALYGNFMDTSSLDDLYGTQ